MITIKIIFLSLLSDIFGTEELTYTANDNSAIEDILEMLSKEFGNNFERVIHNSSGKSNRYVIIALNGEDIRFLESIQTPVHDGDEIIFLPAIAGG